MEGGCCGRMVLWGWCLGRRVLGDDVEGGCYGVFREEGVMREGVVGGGCWGDGVEGGGCYGGSCFGRRVLGGWCYGQHFRTN